MWTHDVSAQPKTGEALLQLVIEDIKWSEETYGLSIIAACSDDGGDACKMWRLLLALMPWLIITLCWAHQIHLVIGDYLSLKLPFQDCVPKALKVIKWMNSHSCALGLFRQEQLFMSQKSLALILPVLTQWTAHYLSLQCLLTVEKALKVVWLKYADNMIASSGSKSEDKAKAIAVQAIINDTHFWYHVKKWVILYISRLLESLQMLIFVWRTCNHLEPLAIVANITQESHTRLYHVLTTLANLYCIYSNLSLPEDLEVCYEVLASLKKCWAAADQDPFIAAVILNLLCSSRTFCSTWVERLRPSHLAHWRHSFCLRYSVRALGVWQYGWYVVTRVWEISQVYEVDSGGLQVLHKQWLDWHKNSDLGSEVGIGTVLNSTTRHLIESVALLTKPIGIVTPLVLSIVVVVALRLTSYRSWPQDSIVQETQNRSVS